MIGPATCIGLNSSDDLDASSFRKTFLAYYNAGDNFPINWPSDKGGTLISFFGDNNYARVQIVIENRYEGNNIYYRTYWGTWGTWKKIALAT